jgi:hypothetical protein
MKAKPREIALAQCPLTESAGLTNAQIAELLAQAAVRAKEPLSRDFAELRGTLKQISFYYAESLGTKIQLSIMEEYPRSGKRGNHPDASTQLESDARGAKR